MFDYTRGAIDKILEDFKKLWLAVNIGLQLFSIVYLLYMHLTHRGFFLINAVLLGLALAYFIFFIVMEFTHGAKKAKKTVGEIYAWCKRIIRLFTIVLTIYGLFVVTKDFTPISLLLLILTIFGFILDILLYCIIKFLTAEAELIMAGVQRDIGEIKKPFQAVGNFFKRSSSEEKEVPLLSKAEQKRNEILDIYAQKRRTLKAQEKAEKREQKQRKKTERKTRKTSVQRIPAPAKEENLLEIDITEN